MSDAPSTPAEAESKPKFNIAPLILPLLNTVAILGAIGLGFYTKIVYKRPAIHEETEKARLEALHSEPATEGVSAFVKWGPLTLNIAPQADPSKSAEEQSADTKLHYLTLTFEMEIRDKTQVEAIEGIRPLLMDKLNQFIGKLHYNELSNAQGRYLVQSHLIDEANQMLAKSLGPEAPKNLVTHIYFTEFVVQ